MRFGEFLQEVCTCLTNNHGWHEHANALIYCQGAPDLMSYLHGLYHEFKTVEITAELVAARLACPVNRDELLAEVKPLVTEQGYDELTYLDLEELVKEVAVIKAFVPDAYIGY